MQAMGAKAKRHRTEVGQTEPDGAQTQNVYPVVTTVKDIRPCVFKTSVILKSENSTEL